MVTRRSRVGTLSANAPLRTITGVAASRRPGAASTLPGPIQVIGLASPRWVITMSPMARRCTFTSPDGVAMRVPAQKQRSVSTVPVPLVVT